MNVDVNAELETFIEEDKAHQEATYAMMRDLLSDSLSSKIATLAMIALAGLKIAAIIWLAVALAGAMNVNVYLAIIAILAVVTRVNINVRKN